MTVSSAPRRAGPYATNGSIAAFPFSFKAFAQSDVRVYVGDATSEVEAAPSTYTVTLNANQELSPGGLVTFTTAPPANRLVSILSEVPYTQELSLPSGGNFSPSALERQLDGLVMQVQQLEERVNRAIILSTSTSSQQVVRVPPSARAGKALVFDAEGNATAGEVSGGSGLSGVVTPFAQTLLDDVNAAQARATLGIIEPSAFGATWLTHEGPIDGIATLGLGGSPVPALSLSGNTYSVTLPNLPVSSIGQIAGMSFVVSASVSAFSSGTATISINGLAPTQLRRVLSTGRTEAIYAPGLSTTPHYARLTVLNQNEVIYEPLKDPVAGQVIKRSFATPVSSSSSSPPVKINFDFGEYNHIEGATWDSTNLRFDLPRGVYLVAFCADVIASGGACTYSLELSNNEETAATGRQYVASGVTHTASLSGVFDSSVGVGNNTLTVQFWRSSGTGTVVFDKGYVSIVRLAHLPPL